MKPFDPLVQKVTTTLLENKLIPAPSLRSTKSTAILVAFSGGADSTALLVALTMLQSRHKLRLLALYVNHGMRSSLVLSAEVSHCRRLCARLRVPLQVKKVDIRSEARSRKLSIETAGREIRYEMLAATASESGASLIATGHHRDDQIETIFFRLLRGGWFDSLVGIPYRRDNIIRPLLDCSKLELIGFLNRQKVRYLADTTNNDRAYTRNAIRHDHLPTLRNSFPGFECSLLNLSSQARVFSDEIVPKAMSFLARYSRMTPGGKLLVDRQRFTRLTEPVNRYVAREAVQRTQGAFVAVAENQMLQVVALADESKAHSKSTINLPGGMRISCVMVPGHFSNTNDLIAFIPTTSQQSAIEFELPLKKSNSIAVFGGKAQLRVSRTRITAIPSSPWSALLDFDRLEGPLSIRTWLPGDRFTPLGMKGRKKVGDFLTDRKIPAFLRDEQLVVCDRVGIIWLSGLAIDERVKIRPTSTWAVRLEYRSGVKLQ